MTYEEAQAWVEKDGDFVYECIEALVDADTGDTPRGFTRTEIREILGAFYDRQWDADTRHMCPDPLPVQVEAAVQYMLACEGGRLAYERDGLFYLHRNEVEEEAIRQGIVKRLGGR